MQQNPKLNADTGKAKRPDIEKSNMAYFVKQGMLLLFLVLVMSCSKDKQESRAESVAQTPVPSHTSAASPAPELRYFPEQLDNTKGLSNSSVNCIFRDSQNLMWIGTWDGLNRYDGSTFRIFRPEPGNKNALSNQVVLKVGEDAAGFIWVLTMHGINRYDKKNDTFRHYYFSRADTPPISESEFNMALDPASKVFCAVKDWGLGYFNGTDFTKINTGAESYSNIRAMEFASEGELLLLNDKNELKLVRLSKGPGDKAFSGGSALLREGVKSFRVIAAGTVCIISEDGDASIMNITTHESIPLSADAENITGVTPGGVMLACRSGYIFRDIKGNTLNAPWHKYLDNHKVTTLIEGSEGVFWSGTDGDGIIKIYPLKKSFNLVSRAQVPGLDGAIIRTFLKTGNNLWVGTKGKGLFRIDAKFYTQPAATPIPHSNYNEYNSPVNNAVYALGKGSDSLVLIGTDGEGLAVFDGRSNRMYGWRDLEGSKSCTYFRSVYSVYTDPQGYSWLGTNGYGMVRCRIYRDGGRLRVSDCKRYVAGSANGSLSSNIIFSILPKNDGQLWVGTRLGGLNLFDIKTERFTSFKNIPSDSESLSNNDILCMAADAGHRLWVGTSFGISMLEGVRGNKAAFKNYTVKDGLPNNTIHGIVPADADNIWISTNMGLSDFSLVNNTFSNYTRSDGLQNNEFADGAFYRDAETGNIFMGGIKGFNYFLPDQIKESRFLPDLFIDRISGHNQAVPYYQNLVIAPNARTHPSLVLKHNQNFFDVHLTALTYTNNEKCQYAYQLRGFDKNWNTIDNRKIISFTNVPQGNYSLMVKWSNSDGVWTRPVNAIDIRVKPVWWQSAPAFIIYTFLGVLFLLFVRSYYLKRQSLQQNILIRKKEEELHENRLSFFTNIAHEFLTPLTLIVGPAQKISESATIDSRNTKYLHMIQRNASRLLFLTQQLLEFRKAEYDYLENTVRKFDLVNLIEQIAELFDDWALDKNIRYTLDVPSSLKGWYDKDKLEKILFNLMSNAFKYTPSGGAISLKCSIEQAGHKKLNITITNTGPGIPKQKLESLFDRFFLADAGKRADTELFRTGIGLAYIKKLVTVLRGEIEVSSTEGEETRFTVLIPCSKEAFAEKEIDTENAPVLVSHHLRNILEEAPEKPVAVPGKIAALDAAGDSRAKVLIVEDEKEIHAYLHDLLADRYRIMAAYNGAEAVAAMEHELPDIIISDVMMPVMDGVELCKKVKTDLRTCHIPFIMLTAKSSVQHRIEGLESGANSYIPKPFYPDHLLVRVQKLLEEKTRILQHFTQDNLIGEVQPEPPGRDDKAFMRTVIELIRKNLENENLDTGFLESALGISASQLYRRTKEIFGLAPGDLIRTIRLKYAAELLRRNEITVSEVCYKAGFNNRSYFYREFKKVYDTTPKNYQLQYKARQAAF